MIGHTLRWAALLLALPTITGVLSPKGPHAEDSNALLAGCTSGSFALQAQDHVSLPYVIEGTTLPDGQWVIEETGGTASTDTLQLSVQGPFEVTGDLTPLEALETRVLTVHYTGPVSSPVIASGTVTLRVDGQTAVADLAAVVGDAALPAAQWEEDAYGTSATLPLPSAPFPNRGSPYSDVLLFVPQGFTDQGDIGITTHLHGHYATLAYTVPDQQLLEQHSLSGRDSLFIIPQGPYYQASGDFGQLMDPRGFFNLVRDSVSVLYRDGFVERPIIGTTTLTSHSGGYLATASILEVGGLPISAVHLFDSLYAEEDVYEDFALQGGVLRSSYTSGGGTDDNNAAFLTTLQADGLEVGTHFDDDSLLAYQVIVGYSASAHNECISDERNYARWLAASGMRRRPSAPPELRTVLSDGTTTQVTWLADADPLTLTYRVQGSSDGTSWQTLADTTSHSASVPARPYLRLVVVDPVYGESDPSDIYGGSGATWLVVDGFDRVLEGSWTAFTHDFAARVGNALGVPFSSASNEAVSAGQVDLSSYNRVLWLLGDESKADLTFDSAEKTAIEQYLAGGGKLLVSGSEVGYATDSSWLSSVLHITYVKDDASTTHAGGYTFGVVYEEDYPDVLSSQTTLWTYDTGGGAAVGWNQQIIVVGFPLETLADSDLEPAVQELAAWLP